MFQSSPLVRSLCHVTSFHAISYSFFKIKGTRWFKYDRDWLCVNKSQFVPVIFEPPCKWKFHPRTGYEGPDGEEKYSSILSLTSVLDTVGGERHASAASPLGERFGTHCGWASLLVWTDVQNVASTGLRLRNVQPVLSWYIDYAITARVSVRFVWILLYLRVYISSGLFRTCFFFSHHNRLHFSFPPYVFYGSPIFSSLGWLPE